MAERFLRSELINDFETHLREDERSMATIQKYIHDIKYFSKFSEGKEISKQCVLDYKKKLGEEYAVASANSMLAALNSFFRFCHWFDLCVKQFKVQRQIYCSEEKELTRAEYVRLLEAARAKKNKRLDLIIQTICGTGIRVSELEYITVEAVQKGEAVVNCKGKKRRVFIVPILQKKLLRYAKERRIFQGMIFITQGGKPISRNSIWKGMKSLCKIAAVNSSKVFPHNLRHLFARTFYGIEKDIAKLADILGHASINTTRIYIATTGIEHRRKMENLRLVI